MENTDKVLGMLPDVFAFADGTRVYDCITWQKRREEIINTAVELEYGGMPDDNVSVTTEALFMHRRLHSYRAFVAVNGREMSFTFGVYVPEAFDKTKKYPVFLDGDGCFMYCDDAVINEANRRGFAVVKFNRTEFAPDMFDESRVSGIYRLFPDSHFSAISAWAWSYTRVIDAIETIDYLDSGEIAATGHSRGGKTVMLAAAFDERIKYANPNCSGLHGVSCYRYCEYYDKSKEKRSETLADMFRVFPYWMGQGMREYIGREESLPHDAHFFTSLIAPRSLLITSAGTDTWCGPKACAQTYRATREVYKFLNAEDKIAYRLRGGLHDQTYDDFCAFFDFIEAQRENKPLSREFTVNPYPEMADIFTWKAPDCGK